MGGDEELGPRRAGHGRLRGLGRRRCAHPWWLRGSHHQALLPLLCSGQSLGIPRIARVVLGSLLGIEANHVNTQRTI